MSHGETPVLVRRQKEGGENMAQSIYCIFPGKGTAGQADGVVLLI